MDTKLKQLEDLSHEERADMRALCAILRKVVAEMDEVLARNGLNKLSVHSLAVTSRDTNLTKALEGDLPAGVGVTTSGLLYSSVDIN